MNTIPKSLHTVTVLVAVARNQLQTRQTDLISCAVESALHILGYGDDSQPDTYQLADKARKILAKQGAA